MSNANDVGPAEGWRTKIWPFPRPAPKPTPAAPEVPDAPDAVRAKFLQAWLLLRQTDMTKVRALLTFVPLVVFFAISGLIVWTWLALRGVWKFLRSLVS